jgi:protein gp37
MSKQGKPTTGEHLGRPAADASQYLNPRPHETIRHPCPPTESEQECNNAALVSMDLWLERNPQWSQRVHREVWEDLVFAIAASTNAALAAEREYNSRCRARMSERKSVHQRLTAQNTSTCTITASTCMRSKTKTNPADSKIEWCDHTFNPWIGCTKVSPGCANCYAEGESKRRGWAQWGKGKERHRTSANYWKQPLLWNGKARSPSAPRQRVFCASLADWLDDEVPIEWLIDLLALIHSTPNLDWLLLTKRLENWVDRMCRAFEHVGVPKTYEQNEGVYALLEGWLSEGPASRIPENVWVGVSVEDQIRADERIPLLLDIPVKIRFLSCEPLLGPVDLTHIAGYTLDGDESNPGYLHSLTGTCYHPLTCRVEPRRDDENPAIDWVIVGGESGAGARPCNVSWIREIILQCKRADVPVFVKQLGTLPLDTDDHFNYRWPEETDRRECSKKECYARLKDRKGGDPSEWPADLRLREFPKTSRRAAGNNMLATTV